jgi:hypothetical protein
VKDRLESRVARLEQESERKKVTVNPVEYRTLLRMAEEDAELADAYFLWRHGYEAGLWEPGYPPSVTDELKAARRLHEEIKPEEAINYVAERTGDAVLTTVWELVAYTRAELEYGKVSEWVRTGSLKARRAETRFWWDHLERKMDSRLDKLLKDGCHAVTDTAHKRATKMVEHCKRYGRITLERMRALQAASGRRKEV